MLSFKPIELSDINTFKHYIGSNEEFSCESAFINLLVWQEAYANMWAESDGQLVISSGKEKNHLMVLMAVIALPRRAVEVMIYCKSGYRSVVILIRHSDSS